MSLGLLTACIAGVLGPIQVAFLCGASQSTGGSRGYEPSRAAYLSPVVKKQAPHIVSGEEQAQPEAPTLT